MRDAVRGLLRRRAFVTTAVLSLGVGIGSATTVLSVLVALLVRPLPYAAPNRIVAIWPGKALASREVEAIEQQTKSFEQISSLSPGWLMPLTHVTTPRELDAGRVSGDLFTLLGVPPLLGRAFGPEAEVTGQDFVAILSYDLWQSAFAGDSSIVGRSIVLGGSPYVVVAVMPRTFRAFAFKSDLWVPLPADHSAMWWTRSTTLAFGRLRPGATIGGASTELATIAPRIQQEFQLAPDWTVGARVVGLKESMVAALRPMVLLLTGAVTLLLALAAANVATLFLVRAAERRNEMAVRAALGATQGRIAALVLWESMAIAVAGGALGVALSKLGVTLLVRILPTALPRLQEITLDLRVLAAAAVLTLLVTVSVGFAPARQATAATQSDRVRQTRTVTGAGERTRGLLISLEMTLALILVIGAALMGRTVIALYRVDSGLESDHLLTMKIEPGSLDDDFLRTYWRAVLARVDAVPGVRSSATILHLPTSGRAWNASIVIEGRPIAPDEQPLQAHWQTVSTNYFRTAGVPLLRGRQFDETDGPGAPLVIGVNSALAARLFGGSDPIGHRISAGNATHDSLATIVAVVGSVRHDSLTAPAGPEVYVPFEQRTVDANSLVVRTSVPPYGLVAAIRDQIQAVNRNVPVSDVRTMDDILAASLARQRMLLILLGLFAGVGLFLSCVGVYGVVAFGAAQRVKEIGIRMALGAEPRAILRLVIWHGLRYAVLGAAVGVPMAFALSGSMRGMVYGVPTTDWMSFLFAPAGLIVVVVAASWIPASRAAALAPTIALAE